MHAVPIVIILLHSWKRCNDQWCSLYFNKSASNAYKLLHECERKGELERKAGSMEEDTAMTLKDIIQRCATAVFKKIRNQV